MTLKWNLKKKLLNKSIKNKYQRVVLEGKGVKDIKRNRNHKYILQK